MISLGRITSVAAVSSSEFCSSKVVQFFDAAASAVALMNWLNASKMSLEASRIAIKRNEKITLKNEIEISLTSSRRSRSHGCHFLVCNVEVRIDSHILNQIDNLGNMYLLSTFDPVAWATTTCQLKVSLTLESERAAGERDKRGKMHSANTHSSSLIQTKKRIVFLVLLWLQKLSWGFTVVQYEGKRKVVA